MVLIQLPPALKCGVTTDAAFQAIGGTAAFQAIGGTAAFQAINVFQMRDVSKNDD
jgi:hypothetical protein